MLIPKLRDSVNNLKSIHIQEERKVILHSFIDYLNTKIAKQEPIQLLFICTHNSRRSTMSQLWAQTMAYVYNVPMKCFSGGTEVTAFNKRAVHTMRGLGFKMEDTNGENPHYAFKISDTFPPLIAYSKLYDAPGNPTSDFAAIMTCDHADANCPIIHGAEKRIPLSYEDPKAFDDSPLEQTMYRKRALQIGSEMLYVFSNLQAHVKQ